MAQQPPVVDEVPISASASVSVGSLIGDSTEHHALSYQGRELSAAEVAAVLMLIDLVRIRRALGVSLPPDPGST
jgi:hypothetical protein